MKFALFLILTFLNPCGLLVASIELLKKSVEYDDQHGYWDRFNEKFSIIFSAPVREDRVSVVFPDNSKDIFSLPSGNAPLAFYIIASEGITVSFGGKLDLLNEDLVIYCSQEKRLNMFRNYMTYFYKLLTKLLDNVTIIHLEVIDVVCSIIPGKRPKATFEEEVRNKMRYLYSAEDGFQKKQGCLR